MKIRRADYAAALYGTENGKHDFDHVFAVVGTDSSVRTGLTHEEARAEAERLNAMPFVKLACEPW